MVVNREAGSYRLFRFDPQSPNPLSYPKLSEGPLPPELREQFVVVGDHLITWTPGQREHTIFDLEGRNPFANPRKGKLPEEFPCATDMALTAAHPGLSVDEKEAEVAGTLSYMRNQIEHVIYYVLESRSFDNVLGWLYENGSPSHWIGAGDSPVFEGASLSNHNTAHNSSHSKVVTQNQYKYTSSTLDKPFNDPFHGTADSIHQQWHKGYSAYQAGEASDMLGFLQNNADKEVMGSYTPAQLSVLNGLAQNYAVSDMWFCSDAGGTTTNRATLASGSAFNITADYESGEAYANFPNNPHRQSMWKVLANHGHTDWAIYYSVEWLGYPYTYHLYLEGQLPSVDEYPGDYVQPIKSFFDAIEHGHLPKFSFLEPVWYLPDGVFTSYHPTGDLLPGEEGLLQIFNALKKNKELFDKTALVISFSKGGGVYDHVPAHKMIKAWPNDGVDGYDFDVTGARVPTIVVSPLVESGTVFRSGNTDIPFDHTSLPATILSWFGIPRSQWGMGDRIAVAPTFESVFTRSTPRDDAPTLTRAGDDKYPANTPIAIAAPTPVDRIWSADGDYSAWTSYQSWVDRPECAALSGEKKQECEEQLPTAKAIFGASSNTTVTFAFASPQTVDEVVFNPEASAYTFLLDEEKPAAPNLTLTGAGVTNHSTTPQTFVVNASNTSPSQVNLNFINSADAGNSSITYKVGPTNELSQSGGIVAFNQYASAGSANFEVGVGPRPIAGYATVGAEVRFLDRSTANAANFEVTGTTGPDGDTFGNVVFHNYAKAGTATFTNVGGTMPRGDGGNTQFYEQAGAARATIHNKGATGGAPPDKETTPTVETSPLTAPRAPNTRPSTTTPRRASTATVA
jgi:phospholipase C